MPPQNRIFGFLKSFPRGINSNVDPLLLPPNQLSFAVNATVRGDFVKQRPNFFKLTLVDNTGGDFQAGLFQGACYYRGLDGSVMCAVNGNLFQITISGNLATVNKIDVKSSSLLPIAPANLNAVSGISVVTLSWSPSENALSYTIQRSTDRSNYSSIASGISSTTYSDSAVAGGSTYYYRVFASNAYGDGNATFPVSATPSAPTVPASLSITSISSSSGQAIIGWSASAGASTYSILRSTSPGAESLIVSGVTELSYIDTGLTNGATYYYKVVAINNVGQSAPSAEASTTPLPSIPPAPTGLSATAQPPGISLSWSASVGSSSYSVSRSLSSNSGYSVIASGLTTLSYTDATVSGSTTYYYTVAASNDSGASPQSSYASATSLAPIPSAPSGLSASISNISPGQNFSFGVVANSGAIAGGLLLDAAALYSAHLAIASASNSYCPYSFVPLVGGSITVNGFVCTIVSFVTSITTNTTPYKLEVTSITAIPKFSGTASPIAGAVSIQPTTQVYYNSLFGTVTNVACQPYSFTNSASGNMTPPVNGVALSFTQPSGATSYNVYASSSQTGAGTKIASISGSGQVVNGVTSGLVGGTAYYFYITAVNASGESAESSRSLLTYV
jgi:fibronectin type 3 domain-containing protein